MRDRRLGIVCALPAEAATLSSDGSVTKAEEVTWISADTCYVVSGIGACNASRGADKLLMAGADSLISWGYAGALDPSLQCGDLVLPETVTSELHRFSVDAGLRQSIAERIGAPAPCRELLSVNEIVRSRQARQRLSAQYKAGALDMESSAVLEMAYRGSVPCAVVRVILDTWNMTIPDYVSNENILGLVGGMLRQPRSIGDLLRLARSYRVARSRLVGVGARLVR